MANAPGFAPTHSSNADRMILPSARNPALRCAAVHGLRTPPMHSAFSRSLSSRFEAGGGAGCQFTTGALWAPPGPRRLFFISGAWRTASANTNAFRFRPTNVYFFCVVVVLVVVVSFSGPVGFPVAEAAAIPAFFPAVF